MELSARYSAGAVLERDEYALETQVRSPESELVYKEEAMGLKGWLSSEEHRLFRFLLFRFLFLCECL